jgi:hypothetical protein
MNRRLAAWFLFFLMVTACWQALYCITVTRGEITGLFFHGAQFRLPPELPGYVYPNSAGYDGEFYRLVAHDPLARKGYWRYMDDARYRARRILIPALAAMLGAGSPAAVDFWFVAVVDVAMALGGVCFLRLAKDACPPLAAAALYLLIPAVVASTDRMVTDGPVMAGFLAVWLFLRERRVGPLLAVLTLLPLARETAVCVTAGVMLLYGSERRYRMALAAAATAVPAVAWWWFVAVHTQPSVAASEVLTVPLWPQFLRFFHQFPRAVPPAVNFLLEGLDKIACLCLWIAFGWLAKTLVGELRRGRVSDDVWLVLPSAALAALAGSPSVMGEAYAFMRVDSLLIAWTALRMLFLRPWCTACYLPASSLALAVYRAGSLLRLLGRS